MNEEIKNVLSYFSRAIGALHDLPDVVHSKESTIHVIPPLGIGSHTYVVTTYRQREVGDSIFIEMMADTGSQRIVLPPAVADLIARQRDQLNTKSRSRASRRSMEERMARGEQPGFLKKRKGGPS